MRHGGARFWFGFLCRSVMVPTTRGGVILSPPWKCLHLLELQLQRLGKKPREIFSESHVEMVKVGEKWAKDTASSFTLVGTLIITIMFATTFTVPGGNNQDGGTHLLARPDIHFVYHSRCSIALYFLHLCPHFHWDPHFAFAATRQWWFSFSHCGGVIVFVFAQQLTERKREEKCAARGRRKGAREFCALIKLYGLGSINNRGI